MYDVIVSVSQGFEGRRLADEAAAWFEYALYLEKRTRHVFHCTVVNDVKATDEIESFRRIGKAFD